MAQFDKTFPTLDCTACILTPKMVQASNHPNITLLSWAEVTEVRGYVGNFQLVIRQKPRYVNTELLYRMRYLSGKMPRLVVGTFRIQTVVEAERLSVWIANSSADPNRVMQISELMINAVDHGNLGITYEDKGRLVDEGTWEQEVERRLALPENAGKSVTVTVTRSGDHLAVLIRDEGPGFDYSQFLHFDESRVFDNHGRGIAMASCSLTMRYLGSGNAVLVTIPMTREAHHADRPGASS